MRSMWTLLTLSACGRIWFARVQAHEDASGKGDAMLDLGCSDGTREGYGDVVVYPTIAACAATWLGAPSLRTASSGQPCGNDRGPCITPSDACSVGWHVCGSSSDVSELLVLSGAECRNLTGAYVAAVSHCVMAMPSCTYPAPGAWPCVAGVDVDCTQPACCGDGSDGGTGCSDGIWPGATLDNKFTGEGCGTLPAANQDGVLCCKG